MTGQRLSRPFSRCLRDVNNDYNCLQVQKRLLSCAIRRRQEATPVSSNAPEPPFPLDPFTVHTPHQERLLKKRTAAQPIGSRRRRAALAQGSSIPFEQLPYQCFQEARKVLAEDREEKLVQIKEMRRRIDKWKTLPAEKQGGDYAKVGRLRSLSKELERLKILADINDPVIKKKFEDGMGDMDRPIYRHLADQKWRSYDRKIIMQRIEQFHIVPDMLHHVDPTVSVSLHFGRRNIQPGEFVDSRISESPPRLRIQCFDKGERFVTIAVMDPDVPDFEKDAFGPRCHFLAVNVPISPTETSLPLANLMKEEHVVLPWLPPHAQKGSPYHRLAIFVLQQENGSLDLQKLGDANTNREGWTVKKLIAQEKSLKPVGISIFRTQWDESMDAVMMRAGIEGAEVQLVRKKSEKNVYKKKDGSRFR